MSGLHNLNMARGLVEIPNAETWSTKTAKGLLKHGKPIIARNEFFISVGYVAWDGKTITTKNGIKTDVPEKFLKWML